MSAAIHHGIKEIHVFDSIEAAKSAANAYLGPKILAGEHNCLAPPGFDLGNSPGDYTSEICHGKTMFFSTTNGTRALVAAKRADHLLAGAIVTASATARLLKSFNQPITLLCSGTSGNISLEDTLGAGAVIHELTKISPITLKNDEAEIASQAYESSQNNLPKSLKRGLGGHNILAAKLSADITFAAQLNAINTTIRVIERNNILVGIKA